MRFLAIVILIFSNLVFSTENAHICYFSLNNEKEFKVMEGIANRLNKLTSSQITVSESQDFMSNPEESFKIMVETKRCDGLVISGHHTGSFGGHRASGTLPIEFLEKLSCDPKYKDFFANIKALWLQGCRTMGVGSDAGIEVDQIDADLHTQRVGEVLEEDDLEQSLGDLNFEFSATLDQDNPLSSRYLRVFPKATVFGWTATAPGVRARSEMSIPYHMAHISRINGQEFVNPTTIEDKEIATRYAAIILGVLSRNNLQPQKSCGDVVEDQIKAWHAHGGRDYDGGELTFSNPDLQARAPLILSEDESLKLARHIECILSDELDIDKLDKILDRVLSETSIIGYSLNRLQELLSRYKTKDPERYNLIVSKLSNSEKFKYFLMKKIASPRTGILRKIDYLVFIKEVFKDLNIDSFKKQILSSYEKLVLTPAIDNFDLIDFQYTTTQSLAKHELIDIKGIEKVLDKAIENSGPSSALAVIANSLSHVKASKIEKIKIATTIIKSSFNDEDSIINLSAAIDENNLLNSDSIELIKRIISSKYSTGQSLKSSVSSILKSSLSSKEKISILEKIIFAKKQSRNLFPLVINQVLNSQMPETWKSSILSRALKSSKLTTDGLNEISFFIADKKIKLKNPRKLILQLLKHPKTDDIVLSSVAMILGDHSSQIKDSLKLMKKIMRSKRVSGELYSGVIYGISGLIIPKDQKEKMVIDIINSQKANEAIVKSICYFISNGHAKNPVKLLSILLRKDFINETDNEEIAAMISEYNKQDIEIFEPIIEEIISSPNKSSWSLMKLAKVLTSNKFGNQEKLLSKIVEYKYFRDEHLAAIREFILHSDYSISNKEELIQKLDQRSIEEDEN